jgi:hypothetical protein
VTSGFRYHQKENLEFYAIDRVGSSCGSPSRELEIQKNLFKPIREKRGKQGFREGLRHIAKARSSR